MFQCLKYLFSYSLVSIFILFDCSLTVNGSFHLPSESIIKAMHFKGTHNPFSTGNRSPNYLALLYFIK